MVEEYRFLDPPLVPQLTVPVTLAKNTYKAGLLSNNLNTIHTGCLIMVAFYFLLRVGEYAKPQLVLKMSLRLRDPYETICGR